MANGIIDATVLWHGTAEAISGPLRCGGYDGLLWTSHQVEIARSYIPASGLSMLWAPRSPLEDGTRVRPDLHGSSWQLALALGFEDVAAERDALGQAIAWKGSTPTHGEIAAKVASLGYDAGTQQWLKMREGRVAPRTGRLEGALYRLQVKAPLRVLDLRTGDFDRSEPSYHDLRSFARAREAGFDGVAIDDMSKDEDGEQLGHESLGLFPSGIAKCAVAAPEPSSHLAFREWFGKAAVLRRA